jgi:hypothetical protein
MGIGIEIGIEIATNVPGNAKKVLPLPPPLRR